MSDNNNAVIAFKGAGLPSNDVGQFRKALTNASNAIQVAGGTPFLKMDKKDGAWIYGANDTEVEEGSLWAINPLSLKVGFVCWNPKGGAPLGKQMVSIFQTPLQITDMPNLGAKWDDNISLELMCTNGEDKGVTVEYTANSYGGKKAFAELVASLQRQLEADPAKLVPVVDLTNDSYKHPQFGLTYNPIFEIKSWIAMDAAPPIAETKPAEQPTQQQSTGQVIEPATAEPARRGRGTRGPVSDVQPETQQPQTAVSANASPATGGAPEVRPRRRRAAG